jgi:EmrB/QacA subfamily drug resistance transporter
MDRDVSRMRSTKDPAPLQLDIQRSPRLIALIVACAYFIQQIDSTIIITSLPQMAASLRTDAVLLGVAVSAYLLSLAIFMPISGWLADRFGASVVFQAAIALFTVSSILCALSENILEITIARLLQGVGGAMMTPVGRLIILRSVEKSKFIGTLMWLQVPGQLGPVIGIPLGGFITTYASWRWNFLTNIPIGILGIVLAAIYIPNTRAEERRPFDWIGFILSGATLAMLLYGLALLGKPTGEILDGVLVLTAAFLAGAVAVLHALRRPHPLIDLSLLRIRTFAVNIHAGSLTRYGIDSVTFLLPLLFQIGFGMTAFDSGMLTLASAIGLVSMRAFAKPLLQKIGFRSVLIVNGFITAGTIAFCAVYTQTMSSVFIFVTLAIGGCFRSLQLVALNTIAYADVPAPGMSSATSFAGMVQQLSNAIAVAIAAIALHALLALQHTDSLTAIDFRITLLAMAGISLLGIPLFFALPRNAGSEFSGHVGKAG